MTGEEQTPAAPHVLMVSFPAQGHVNPLLRLAKRLAAKGLLVTFTSTADIGDRISSSAAAAGDDAEAGAGGGKVGRGRLQLEFFPDGWETFDPRRADLDLLMPLLRTVGPPALAGIIRRSADSGCPVSCIINNPFVPWALDVAAEMGIPGAVLWVQSCAVFSTYYHFHHSLLDFPTEENPDVSVHLPGLPTLTSGDIPTFLLPSNPYTALKNIILEQFHNLSKATWVFANTFEELERDAIQAISKLFGVIPVGPLVEVDSDGTQGSIRGDLFKAADCMEWLESQEPRSVIYVSVGSVVILGREEMHEMAYGLKSCGRPFLWVVRDDCRELLPEGFEEEMRESGVVVGWSKQDRVLTHPAVGCFVTHCGWNSTLEAITAGVPVIAYPQWGDQVTDAKFLVDVYGLGVRLPSPVARAELEKCVAAVTTGPEAEEIMGRAAELSAAAKAAVAEGGSSDRNIEDFVAQIRGRACGGKEALA